MVRTLDPERSDLALIILKKVRKFFGISHEETKSLGYEKSVDFLAKLFKTEEYHDLVQRNKDIKFRFKSSCEEANITNNKHKNFENFHSYSIFEKNEIVICSDEIHNEAQLRRAVDRELTLSDLQRREIEPEEKYQKNFVDKKFALNSFLACRKSYEPYFSKGVKIEENEKLKETSKICATYYSKNFGLNQNSYPFDIWARYSRDLVNEVVKELYSE